MREYPASLSKIKIDIWRYVDPVVEELLETNNFDYRVSVRLDKLQDLIEEIDAYRMSDFWYRGMSSYYCGILSYYPWEQICNSNDEERIWGYILKYHTIVDTKRGTIVFKHNDKSPISKWLRQHTSDGDVPINVMVIMRTALKYLLDKADENNLFGLEEYCYCYKCEAHTVPTGRWGDCEICGESHWEEPEEDDEEEFQKDCSPYLPEVYEMEMK